MQADAVLALLAELGVGFAGFVAIFLIFARGEGRFSPADSLRVRSIITSSFQVVFGALLPLVLSLYGLTGRDLWLASSLVALVAGLAIATHIARVHWALSAEDRGEVGLLHSFVSWGLGAVASTLLVLNIAGAVSEPAAAPYVAALVCLLGIGTSNFVTIAFLRLL